MGDQSIFYQQYRSDMKDGDVLLFKGKGLLSSIIKWKTDSAYSHAGIVLWWNERLMVLEAVGRGVMATPISYNLNKYQGGIDYYRSARDIDNATRKAMAQFAQSQLGKEYDTAQLIRFGLKLMVGSRLNSSDRSQKTGQYFCSQYVADIYARHGHDLALGLSDDYTSPDRLAESKGLDFVGTLKSASESDIVGLADNQQVA